MSPIIRISDESFARLQKHATPFIDTPAIVIERMLDYYDLHQDSSSKTTESTKPKPLDLQPTSVLFNDAKQYDPFSPPNLTHTDPLHIELNGQRIPKLNWASLIDEVHRAAFRRLDPVKALMISSIIVKGRKEDEGFHYKDDIDASIRGVDAKHAWSISLDIAQKLHIPIQVVFKWKPKKGADHPGEVGVLSWRPLSRDQHPPLTQ